MTHLSELQIQPFVSKKNIFKLFIAFVYLIIVWFFVYDLLINYLNYNDGHHFLFKLL